MWKSGRATLLECLICPMFRLQEPHCYAGKGGVHHRLYGHCDVQCLHVSDMKGQKENMNYGSIGIESHLLFEYLYLIIRNNL